MSYPDIFSTAPREPEPPIRRRNNPRGDAVWEQARLEYAAGAPAEAICETYGLARSTLFARARAEGWRRMDLVQNDPDALRDESDIAPAPAPPTPELIELAWRLMAEAARAGKPNETKSWLKVWQTLSAVGDKTKRQDDVQAFTTKLMAMSPSLEPRASRRSAEASLLSMTMGGGAKPACHPEERPAGTRLEGRTRPVPEKSTLAPVLDCSDSKNDEAAVSPAERLNRRQRRRLEAAEARLERSRQRAHQRIDKLAEQLATF